MQALAARQSGLAQWRIEVVDLFWRSAVLFRLYAKDRSVFAGSVQKIEEVGGWRMDRPPLCLQVRWISMSQLAKHERSR